MYTIKKILDYKQKVDKYIPEVKGCLAQLREEVKKNAEIACSKAEAVLLRKTPHADDGKPRGKNMITNSLRDSWHVSYKIGRTGLFCKIIMENDKEYASYVQYGHKQTKHFVPWLYKDGSVLSYETNHNQPLFGITVGGKNPFVKGIDMLGPAEKKFKKTMTNLMVKSIYNIFMNKSREYLE